jgi:hypothetical protein
MKMKFDDVIAQKAAVFQEQHGMQRGIAFVVGRIEIGFVLEERRKDSESEGSDAIPMNADSI